eukprot:963623-Pyramimonas_sp.AAC.1
MDAFQTRGQPPRWITVSVYYATPFVSLQSFTVGALKGVLLQSSDVRLDSQSVRLVLRPCVGTNHRGAS